MAVVVVGAGGDDRHRRPDRLEEPLGVGRPTVVRHLEDVAAQPCRIAQQQLLGGGLGIAGQQHAAAAVRHAQHQRGIVDPLDGKRVGRIGRRAQDLDGGATEREALPGAERHHRDPAPGGDGARLPGRRRTAVRLTRCHHHRSDGEVLQDRGQPIAVVGVRMAEGNDLQALHAAAGQRRDHELRIGAGVDQHAGRPGIRRAVGGRHLHQHRVALSHVQSGDRQGGDPDRAGDGQDGQHGQREGRREGRHRNPATSQPQGNDHHDHQDHHDHHDDDGRQRDRRAGEVASRHRGPAGEGRRHTEHHRQEGCRRDGQQSPRGRGDLGRQRRGRADDRGGTGSRNGQQVGRQCGQWQAVVGDQQDRRDRHLRPDAGGQQRSQHDWAAQPRAHEWRQHQHARRRRHRQQETELAGKERIDQQQHDHGDAEGVARIGPAAAHRSRQHQQGHRRGAQHRRLEAHQHGEPHHHGCGTRARRPNPRTGERRDPERPGDHERHVGPGHRHQVRQAGRLELRLPLVALTGGVAGDQPGQQHRVVVGQPARRGRAHAAADGGRGGQPIGRRRDDLQLPRRPQRHAGVQPAEVPLEALAAERPGRGGEPDTGTERGNGLHGGPRRRNGAFRRWRQAQQPAGPGRQPADIVDAHQQPGPVRCAARVGDDGRGHAGTATALGELAERAPVQQGEVRTGEAAAQRAQRQRGQGQPASAPESRPGTGPTADGAEHPHHAQRRGGGDGERPRSGQQAPQPQGGGEQRHRTGAHRCVTRSPARRWSGSATRRCRAPPAAAPRS